MPSFSVQSNDHLIQCDRRLQFIANKAIRIVDFSITCGYRGARAQQAAFDAGRSNAKFGESGHNVTPAMAFDFVPYPVDWHDHERFAKIAGICMGIATANGIPLSWGGDWKEFIDRPHIELTNWQQEN